MLINSLQIETLEKTTLKMIEIEMDLSLKINFKNLKKFINSLTKIDNLNKTKIEKILKFIQKVIQIENNLNYNLIN